MRVLGIIWLLVILPGCRKSVEPLASLTTIERIIEGGYDGLYLDGEVDLIYTPLDSTVAFVEAYPGDHENVLTHVEGSSLIVQSREGMYPEMYRRLYIKGEAPRRIVYAGSGALELEGFTFSNLNCQIRGSGRVSLTGLANSVEGVFSGTGQMHLAGEASVLSVNHQGTGDIEATDLLVGSCKVEINGPGDAYIHVLSNMTIILNGTGNVYYTGPVTQIVVIYNGSGELIRLPD